MKKKHQTYRIVIGAEKGRMSKHRFHFSKKIPSIRHMSLDDMIEISDSLTAYREQRATLLNKEHSVPIKACIKIVTKNKKPQDVEEYISKMNAAIIKKNQVENKPDAKTKSLYAELMKND